MTTHDVRRSNDVKSCSRTWCADSLPEGGPQFVPTGYFLFVTIATPGVPSADCQLTRASMGKPLEGA